MKKTWDERARAVIAQGCLTYSKRSDQFVKGIYPTHLQAAGGCFVVDAEGQGYTDFIGGLGSSLITNDNNYCLPTTAEVELAEALRKRFPCMEKMKILKTGSEACQAAVRVARAWHENNTKQPPCHGVGMGYHGWHNWCISAEEPGRGCISTFYKKAANDENLLWGIKHGGYAYCIVEPVMLDMDDERGRFLCKLREACTKHNTILIFDEVITGMRVPKASVANYYGVQPDIMCMGKALGNGFPIAVVGGKADIMDTPDYFVSSTFAGELRSLASALNVLNIMDDEQIEALWKRGAWFQKVFNAISPKIWLHGFPTKAVFEAESEEYKAMFFQEMVRREVLFGKAWHIWMAHTYDVLEQTISKCKDAIQQIEDGNVKLEGELPKPVFKRY